MNFAAGISTVCSQPGSQRPHMLQRPSTSTNQQTKTCRGAARACVGRAAPCAVWLTLRPEMPYFRSLGIYRKSVITVFTKKNIFKSLNEFLDETFVPRHGAAAARAQL